MLWSLPTLFVSSVGTSTKPPPSKYWSSDFGLTIVPKRALHGLTRAKHLATALLGCSFNWQQKYLLSTIQLLNVVQVLKVRLRWIIIMQPGHFILVRTKAQSATFVCKNPYIHPTHHPLPPPPPPQTENTAWHLWPVGDRINGFPLCGYLGICLWIYHWVVSQMFRACTSYSRHFMNDCWRIKDRCIFQNSPLLHTTIGTA